MPNDHPDIPLDRSQLSTLPEAQRHEAQAHREALLDAGLIGNPAPIAPEQLANIRRAEAIFRAGALYRRQSTLHFFWEGAR